MFTINLKELRHIKRFEKFSLNFSISLMVIRVNLLYPHLCSLMVYYYLLSVFLSSIKIIISVFLQFKCNCLDGQKTQNTVT